MRSSFNITRKEIETAHSSPCTERRIYYEYVSKYRRIVVLGKDKGFEICVSYKGMAKEYNKTWSTHWGELNDAIGWAGEYAKNRNIVCGILTILEQAGNRLI